MIKRLMLLSVCIAAVIALTYAESIEKGLTPLKDTGDSLYNDGIYITTDAATDTSYTKWYLVDKIGTYNSLRVVIDSVEGAFTLAIDLQESWDGAAVEFTTSLMSATMGDTARRDTVLEVNYYPAPYIRFLLRETDAASGESLQIDSLVLFSK